MLEPQAPKTKRDIVRDTFTSPRIGLLSWAFAAVIMGTVGFASYQFSSGSFTPEVFTSAAPVAFPLPAPGDIETTASIGTNIPVAVLNLSESGQSTAPANLEQSQIEVLQREVVGLRRRLVALSEQNLAYSRRIAALEREVAKTRLASAGKLASTEDVVAGLEVIPRPGVVVSNTPQKPVEAGRTPGPPSGKPKSEVAAEPPFATMPDPVKSDFAKTGAIDTGQVDIDRLSTPPETLPAPELNKQEPVRIISQSPEESTELTTASIPTTNDRVTETFNATPTRSRLAPNVITPSDPAGQISGGGDSQIKRSDFGAVIGHFQTTAGAAKAWADFKEQNEERMRDLRPLIMERQVQEGGVALMIGPFANAADASVACLRLLDTADICRPAIYAGDPLVTAAEFRDSAF